MGTMQRRVFMTVGEVSGDRHAAAFIARLRELEPGIGVEGLGGPAMQRAGATIHHETVGGAAMMYNGLLRAGEFWRLLRWTRKYYAAHKPDLHVCVDSSGINLHFARLARQFGVPVLYYIAPQIWASRPGRIKKIRRWVNRVACIIPFEEEYYRSRGVDAHFVGHPLFDEIPAVRPSVGRPPAEMELPCRRPVVGFLPGSRNSEVRANFPRMIAVAGMIQQAFGQASFVVATTASTHQTASQIARSAGGPEMTIEADAIDRMMPLCDLCIAKSGTTTLHVAAYGVPMIVVYHINPVLWHLLSGLVLTTQSYALVNLLNGPRVADRIVPEIIPWYGSIAPVGKLAVEMLRQPRQLDAQRRELARVVAALDRPGASRNAAQLALEMIRRPSF